MRRARSSSAVRLNRPATWIAGAISTYWKADFSAFRTPGHYILRAATANSVVSSCSFQIDDDLLERTTLSNVLFYFKGQRASGDMDRADRHLAAARRSGHRGRAWRLVRRHRRLRHSSLAPEPDLILQSAAGAAGRMDAACELQHARRRGTMTTSANMSGAFWMKACSARIFWCASSGRTDRSSRASTDRGRQKLAKDRKIGNPNWRTQIKTKASESTERAAPVASGPHAYEAGYRAGAGMSIAALALASTMPAGWRLYARAISADRRRRLRLSGSAQSRAAERPHGKYPGRLLRVDGRDGAVSRQLTRRSISRRRTSAPHT